MILGAQAALLGAFGVEGGGEILVKAGAFRRWSSDEIRTAQSRLSREMSSYEPDDWVSLVDLILQSHLPQDKLQELTDRFSWTNYLAARIDAVSAIGAGIAPNIALLSFLSKIRTGPKPAVVMAQKAAWGFARSRVGLFLQGLVEDARRRLSLSIIRHIEEHGLARPALLAQALRDDFGV